MTWNNILAIFNLKIGAGDELASVELVGLGWDDNLAAGVNIMACGTV